MRHLEHRPWAASVLAVATSLHYMCLSVCVVFTLHMRHHEHLPWPPAQTRPVTAVHAQSWLFFHGSSTIGGGMPRISMSESGRTELNLVPSSSRILYLPSFSMKPTTVPAWQTMTRIRRISYTLLLHDRR